MKRIICLALTGIMTASVAQSQTAKQIAAEKDLKAAINIFTNANRDTWNDFDKTMSNLHDSDVVSRAEKFRNASFTKAFNIFNEANGDKYAAIRSVRFAQYAPPPPALLALKWDSTSLGAPKSLFGQIDLFSMSFLRAFEPTVIAQMAGSLLAVELFSQTSMQHQGMQYYRTRSRFGIQVYTRQLSKNVWQIWSADRILAMTFRFDVRTGIMSDVSRTDPDDPAYAKIVWPRSIAHPISETIRLSDDLLRSIWDTYPGPGQNSQDSYLTSNTDKLTDFLEANRKRYRSAREHELNMLEQPPVQLSGFKELTMAEDNIPLDRDSATNAAMIIYPQQWHTAIEQEAYRYFDLDNKAHVRRIQQNAIFGTNSYARKVNENEWEVSTIGAQDASSCILDLRTGHIRKARYWVYMPR